jgi:hypothetical protein
MHARRAREAGTEPDGYDRGADWGADG